MILGGEEPAGWRCDECRAEGLRGMRGCDGPAESNVGFAWAPDLERCPWAVIAEEDLGDGIWELLAAWQTWRLVRVLPWPGGMAMQPAWLVQAFEVIQAVHRQLVRERKAKSERTMMEMIAAATRWRPNA